QLVVRDVLRRDRLVRADRSAVERQRAGGRQRGDDHLEQVVRRAGVRGGEREVGSLERVCRILVRADRGVRGRRSVVNRPDGDRHRRGARRVVAAAVVLDLERERRVAGAVGIGCRREHQLVRRDVGRQDRLVGRYRDAVQRQRTSGRQRGNDHLEQVVRRAVVRVGEREVGGLERVRRVFVGADRGVRRRRRIVHRGDVDRHRRGARRVGAAVRGAAVVLDLERERGGAVGVGRRREYQLVVRYILRRDRLV